MEQVGNTSLGSQEGLIPHLETTPLIAPALIPVNTHLMQTRSKHGIFKPKLYITASANHEPSTINGTFLSPKWFDATQQEYDALLKNHT